MTKIPDTPAQPLVSVNMVAYNQDAFVSQAIDSVLAQVRDFGLELIIGEDCSTDRTRDIVIDYQHRFPDVIRIVSSESNVGLNANAHRVFQASRGEYLAFCEGDDYWTDPHKLEKQIRFLEEHPEYSACSHYSAVFDESTQAFRSPEKRPVAFDYSQADLVRGRKQETRTSSIVCRRSCLPDPWPDMLLHASTVDNFLRLLLTEHGRWHVLPEYMSCYRLHRGSLWSSQDAAVVRRWKGSDLDLLAANYGDRYPDIVQYRRDLHDFAYAHHTASEESRILAIGHVLKMLRYPGFVASQPVRYFGKLAKVAWMGKLGGRAR